MKRFVPVHDYGLDPNGVTDRVTLHFAADVLAVYSALYQGMAPIGEWIQARVSHLIRGWLPGWITSHGQIADPAEPAIQSRSWDIIVHRPIPSEAGYPPPATPTGPYALVPKEMCCAAIDTKGRYNSPQEYVKALAFDLPNRCDVPQLGFIGGDIVPILFIVASTYSPETVEASGTQCGLSTFVLARAVDGKRPDGTVFVNWHLNPGHDTISPMQKFRDTLIRTADEWEERHRSRPTS